MERKTSYGITLGFSIVSLIFSILGIISMIMIYVMFIYAGSGHGTQAVTNEAVLGITGAIFFIGMMWFFAGLGALIGFIMTIVGIASKNTKILWIPVVSLILGMIPYVITIMFAFR